ncbi:BnaA08g04500D [Brassica napus]|uniref:BnaA08g04500D protein n=2 Tax=Brassica TaxID=3705 RepID=A0A078HDZ6_BRANA|nr:BnaA08g04500D [Brassica napus]
MSSSYVLLANLRAVRCSNTTELRLLRFWEAHNVRKGGGLMSVDMLLLDEQSTLIHGPST